ncbi:MAG: DUF4339 domain-containing protein [Polyangiaceae bacterium]|nr:DUF4339 domain-containing protein [Polyangiaceae bacterium]
MAHPVGCSACGATFQLSDELYQRRFRGRTVTLRCRKCSASITVDATAEGPPSDTSGRSAGVEGTPTVPLAFPGPGGSLPWLVSFADDDDRELDDAGIAAALASGQIDGATIVWREGLDEWKPIAEIPALAARLPPPTEPQPESVEPSTRRKIDPVPLGASPDADDEVPVSIEPEPLSSGPAWPDSTDRPGQVVALSGGTLGVPAGRHLPAPPRAPARRVPEPRATGAADAGTPSPPPPRARAGSQPDRAPPPPPRRRIESEPEARPSEEPPSIASLAPVAPRAKKSEAAADELLSLGGGGLLLAPPDPAALLAPAEAPPPLTGIAGALDPPAATEPRRRPGPSEGDRSSPTSPLASSAAPAAASRDPAPASPTSRRVGLGLVAVAAIGLAVWVGTRGASPGGPAREGGSAGAPATAAGGPVPERPVGTSAVDPLPPATGTEPPPPETTTSPSPPATGTAASPAGSPAPGRPPTGVGPGPAAAGGSPVPTSTAPAPTGAPPSTGASPSTPPTPAGDPPPAAPPAGAEFDKGAARAALDAAAGAASGCRKDGDPSGVAQVAVTFAPSGRVTSAVVSGPPFAGTATGGCIAAALRRARVPPFSGDPVTVGKRVVVQ